MSRSEQIGKHYPFLIDRLSVIMSGEKWGMAVIIIDVWGKKASNSWSRESNQGMMKGINATIRCT
jgi:hypothetical protein